MGSEAGGYYKLMAATTPAAAFRDHVSGGRGVARRSASCSAVTGLHSRVKVPQSAPPTGSPAARPAKPLAKPGPSPVALVAKNGSATGVQPTQCVLPYRNGLASFLTPLDAARFPSPAYSSWFASIFVGS